jgi:hypothetical protein
MSTQDWLLVLAALLFAGLGWYQFKKMRKTGQPIFTKENFSKTMTTWGFLTLMLIAVIAFCVILLKK